MRWGEDKLLQHLHEGMFDTPLWAPFLRHFLQASDAKFVSLAFRPPDSEHLIALTSGEGPSHFLETLLRPHPDGGHGDPIHRAQGTTPMRDGRVYALDDIGDGSAEAQALFMRDVMHPYGLVHMRVVHVTEPSGFAIWLACAGGRNMGSHVGTLLNILAPHLRIAMRAFAVLEKEKYRTVVTDHAFRRMKLGWLTVDARGHILDSTPNIEQMLAWGELLRRGRYDRLEPLSPAIDRALGHLLRSYATDTEARPQAFCLSSDPWVDMLVTPAQRSDRIVGRSPLAVIYVNGDRRSQADRCEQLVDLFGLLPSEARLAWLLGQAISIADSAKILGLTLDTARNYSKKIYAKTGASGHAELVRIIMTSVLAMQ